MLFEVDIALKGYEDNPVRHTYVVAADDNVQARRKAEKKFRGWLATNTLTTFVREAEIVR